MDGMAQATQANPGADQLFADMQKTAVERLGTALDVVMRQADDYLFDRSAQAAEGVELTALRDLRRARAQLRQTFESSVVSAFQRLRRGPMPTETVKRELNLLSEDALEEQLASEQMIDNLFRRHAVSLEMLEQRLALLAERSVLAPGDNPISPAALAQAMRDALGAVELSTSLRIALYKFTERELATALTSLYDRINARLGEAGILPRLLPSLPPVQDAMAPEAPAASNDAPTEAVAAVAESPSDHALFSSLIGMLQSWRRHMVPDVGETRQGSAALGVPQLMSALSLLQSDPPGMLDQAVGDARVSLGDSATAAAAATASAGASLRAAGASGETASSTAGNDGSSRGRIPASPRRALIRSYSGVNAVASSRSVNL